MATQSLPNLQFCYHDVSSGGGLAVECRVTCPLVVMMPPRIWSKLI